MNTTDTVIILGSARRHSNTQFICAELQRLLQADLIDLQEYNIHPYDYGHIHQKDDFLPLMRQIVGRYQRIIFATPVYWYSMSAQLKIFFDRITDLLKTDKPTGRLLRGKSMAMLSCGSDDFRVPGFAEPFSYSANYLGMNYLGDVHTWVEKQGEMPEEVRVRIQEFAEAIQKVAPSH